METLKTFENLRSGPTTATATATASTATFGTMPRQYSARSFFRPQALRWDMAAAMVKLWRICAITRLGQSPLSSVRAAKEHSFQRPKRLDPYRRVQQTFPLRWRGGDTPAIGLQTLNLRRPASSELQVQALCAKDCGQLHLFQWFSPSQFFCRTRRHPAMEGTDPICTQKARPSWRPASQWWDMPEMLGTQELHLFVYSHPYDSYVFRFICS